MHRGVIPYVMVIIKDAHFIHYGRGFATLHPIKNMAKPNSPAPVGIQTNTSDWLSKAARHALSCNADLKVLNLNKSRSEAFSGSVEGSSSECKGGLLLGSLCGNVFKRFLSKVFWFRPDFCLFLSSLVF